MTRIQFKKFWSLADLNVFITEPENINIEIIQIIETEEGNLKVYFFIP
jgi:hypothetical protein